MTTKSKSTTKKYHQLSGTQLVTLIRKWQKRYTSLANTPSWKTTAGWTPAQQRACLKREMVRAASVLKTVTLQQANDKLSALKAQIANRLGVSIKSSKVTSAAIKRLIVKCRAINSCKNHVKLATICGSFKVSSFKNPKGTATFGRTTVRASGRTKVRTSGRTSGRTTYYGSTRRTTGTGSYTGSYGVGSTSSTASLTAKHNKQTKTLKKEIQKLKQRNSFMRSQVAKFRRDAAQLQRHYGTLSTQTPSWKVVSNRKVGQDVSNIVRFSNALNNAFVKQQRSVG